MQLLPCNTPHRYKGCETHPGNAIPLGKWPSQGLAQHLERALLVWRGEDFRTLAYQQSNRFRSELGAPGQ